MRHPWLLENRQDRSKGLSDGETDADNVSREVEQTVPES